MSREEDPTLGEVIREALAKCVRELNVHLPGIVQSYDSQTQKAIVSPAIRRTFLNEEGEIATEVIPPISDVPIAFPGSGEFGMTFPIKAGDTVLLMFSDLSIDVWLQRGSIVDPGDDRSHALSDAIAIPGLRPFVSATDQVDDAATVIRGNMKLGSKDASDPVALKSDLDTLKDAISNATTTGGDGGAAFKAAILAALTSWPVSSTKVQAE